MDLQDLKLRLSIFITTLAICATAQTPLPLRTVRVQYMSDTEREATVLDQGTLVHDEDDPSEVWIGDGQTAGGLRVNPSYAWDHTATQDIVMDGHRIQLGEGYQVYTIGGWSAISGVGELSAGNGTAQWALNGDSYIRLTGGVELLTITQFAWDNTTTQFVFTVSSTNAVTMQHSTDLITPNWTNITADASTVTNNSTIIRIAPPAEVGYFRAVGSTGDDAQVQIDRELKPNKGIAGFTEGRFQGIYTNQNPTLMTPTAVGDWWIDVGSNTTVRAFGLTTNDWRFTTWTAH